MRQSTGCCFFVQPPFVKILSVQLGPLQKNRKRLHWTEQTVPKAEWDAERLGDLEGRAVSVFTAADGASGATKEDYLMLAAGLLDHWPLSHWQHCRVLVAVSGGADSVALLCGLRELVEPERLAAAHYNHGWRGAASDADEAFVVALCQQLGIPCIVNRARPEIPELNQNDSASCVESAMLAKARVGASGAPPRLLESEEAARNARYQFFIDTAYEHGARYVATAHTADDRVETLLHNLFRGTGLPGAASLKMFRPLHQDLVLVRPLLAKTREDVLQYLTARQQNYCTDASNVEERYARNFLRHRVLPAVRLRYGDADANLLSFSQLAEEALGDIRLLAERWLAHREGEWEALLSEPHSASNVPTASWREHRFWVTSALAAAGQPWTVLREALRLVWLERGWPLGDMSRSQWELVRNLVQSAAESSAVEQQAVRTLAVLPGALVVETAGPYLAIGRKLP